MGELRLDVHEFTDLTSWRWVLTQPGGSLVAEHEVRLDVGSWQYEAFRNLRAYLHWHVAPDRRLRDETRIIAEVGAWIGVEVLGPIAPALLGASPVTVRVTAPAAAQGLLFLPLELAHVQDLPLSVQGVTFVMCPDATAPVSPDQPPGAALRVLGLFSVPEGGQPLNSRWERHALMRLMEWIEAGGRAMDVRVLQYGVTRERLRDVLAEREGWDVIHISGHGRPGELLLEHRDGSPDPMAAGDLADLLRLARERVKLVTVSTCWSAALPAAERRRLLGLPGAGHIPAGDTASGPRADAPTGSLATELARRLDCAVLAMRYPVTEDFATSLTMTLYEQLASEGHPLPRALGVALARAVVIPPTPACPALSAGTPALFGTRALGLRLEAPRRDHPADDDPDTAKLSGFPQQPERFVGRTGVMARASAALADASQVPGVLLHGMPGSGKTACALELAFTHELTFDRLVWFKAPDEGLDITGSLAEFALTLERCLPDVQLAHLIADPAAFTSFLPRLTELAANRRVAIVIDNIESLLDETGRWRDARWGQLIEALSAHCGSGRLILTSRRMPSSETGLQAEPVDALSLDESLLLIRELPHLRELVYGTPPGIGADEARKLARGVVRMAQGHPKLLELADGQAAEPDRLADLIQAGDQAWQQVGGLPDGFFATGEPQAQAADYLTVLGAWTRMVADGLSAAARILFWFLCCLQEGDRIWPVAEINWGILWTQLGGPGDSPDLDETLGITARTGLIAIQPGTARVHEGYGVHPGIAAAGRSHAGKEFRDTVDTGLAMYWTALARYARDRETDNRGGVIVLRAELSAVPYLIRRRDWSAAVHAIEHAFLRDRSRKTAAILTPVLEEIVAEGDEPRAAIILARVLELTDPAEAESRTRAYIADAASRGDYASASVAIGYLMDQCMAREALAEALALADQKIGYTRQAGLGPWSQLSDETERLHLLAQMGRSEDVLAGVSRLRAHMLTLGPVDREHETVTSWAVREALFATGRTAAADLGRHEEALEFGATIAASQRDRGAPAADLAQTRFNDYGPLTELGRIDEALALLIECRQAFADASDIRGLAKVLSALASVEGDRGHGDIAVTMERDAIRYSYLSGEVLDVAISHHNLGTYLARYAHRPADALPHHLAAALIFTLTDSDEVARSMRAAQTGLRVLRDGPGVPADLAELCGQVAKVPGVDLAQLIAILTADPRGAAEAFLTLLGRVRALSLSRFLAGWDPVIAALLATDSGDPQVVAELDQVLDHYESSDDWGGLVTALRRVQSGETDPVLFEGLPDVPAVIVTRAIAARQGAAEIPGELRRAVRMGGLLGDMVAAAAGEVAAAERVRPYLESESGESGRGRIAEVLLRILDGERDPGIAAHLDDPTDAAVVATILYHLGAGPA